MYQKIDSCRVCENRNLESILDLGQQHLTGIFPHKREPPVARAPMELVKCHGPAGSQHCGLVQTRFSYDLGLLYGGEYGYRSGLNRSMVLHLEGIVRDLLDLVRPSTGDLLLDIGANDGTLLSCYPEEGLELVGMDPTADRFAAYYKPHIRRVADFFSAEKFRAIFAERKAKIVTSIAMFYDLERPMDFMRQVASVLDDDGVWHFEQSYLPAMLAANSYDTACHEHLEYYALRQIKYMADRTGLKILDVQVNDVNGGSFAVTVAKAGRGTPRMRHGLKSSCGARRNWGWVRFALCGLSRGGTRASRRVPEPAGELEIRRPLRDRLWRFDQGQRDPAVLRHHAAALAVHRRSQRGEIRLFHAGDRDPDYLGNRGACHASGLHAGAAVAFPPRHLRARIGLPGRRRQTDFPLAPDRGRRAMKRAIVVGSSGQDGEILFERLRAQGHYVVGLDLGGIRCTETADFPPVNILRPAAVESLLAAVVPDEVYYLAAFHRSAEESAADDRVEFEQSFAIQVSGLLNFLAAIQEKSRRTRLFYAGSARIFGIPDRIPQDEDTPINPDCVYGISKAAGLRCLRYYRRTHGLFAVAGILYNHESPQRPPRFVTQKIVRAVAAIKAGEQSRLLLGDLDAVVDWGYAPDYVDAMMRMLDLSEPHDFIVATGEPHSVREFAEVAFACAGLDWRRHVEVAPSLVSRQPRKLVGNPQRLKAATGWQPSVSFSEMIQILLAAEERRRELA